jgi:iron complex outermembrane receptor protein
MTQHVFAHGWRRSRRRFLAPAVAAAALAALALPPLGAQQTARDSTTDSTRVQRLERVTISAVRGNGVAPISQKTLTQAQLAPRYFGQDVPLLLRGAAPSLTSYAETGNFWGYSYIRLRGVDQSRINLTVDGIPLNDPEDEVLYFADFPDLASSIASVQVQRGVGTTSNGTAAYGGSINMETVPLASTTGGTEVQAEAGSFGSYRANVQYSTGLLPSRFAAYARLSDLQTDGYRYHSGVMGRSAFVSVGYFGDTDILKFTATGGLMRDTMAYLAVSAADLATDRRINPLTPQETDQFGERLAALSYSRVLGASSSATTTVYRLSSTGNYNALYDQMWNFHLDFAWYGVTSAWHLRRGALQADAGVNANTYARDHYAYIEPDVTDAQYFNTGRKGDVSGFGKVAYQAGRATLFGDVQLRHARFHYLPSANAGIQAQSIDWTFLNPKGGITVALSAPLSVYASYGTSTREPARSDMFAGFDNLDTSNVAFVGALTRVKPESVRDAELGMHWSSARVHASADAYSMDFRNEIAPIGVLSYQGTPLRKNVPSSFRRGVEADASWQATPRLLLEANVALSHDRIRDYTDSTGDVPVTYHDVAPLLSPTVLTGQRLEVRLPHALSANLFGRYEGRSFLGNDNDARFVLPASYTMDAEASWHHQHETVTLRVNNVTDNHKFGSGYADGTDSYYYVLPPRSLFLTVTLDWPRGSGM